MYISIYDSIFSENFQVILDIRNLFPIFSLKVYCFLTDILFPDIDTFFQNRYDESYKYCEQIFTSKKFSQAALHLAAANTAGREKGMIIL